MLSDCNAPLQQTYVIRKFPMRSYVHHNPVKQCTKFHQNVFVNKPDMTLDLFSIIEDKYVDLLQLIPHESISVKTLLYNNQMKPRTKFV